MVNSKAKGNRGERAWARFCREQGYEVRRTQQYSGGVEDSADCVGLPGIHQEVKYGYSVTIELLRDFLRQAMDDEVKYRKGKQRRYPIVAHKEDYGKWFVTMETGDFVRMYGGCFDLQEVPTLTNEITYVTLPAIDWFEIYKEWEKS